MARPGGRRHTPLLLMAAVGVILALLLLVLSRRADTVNSTASRHREQKMAEGLVEEKVISVPPQGEIQSERKAPLLQELTIEEDEREDNTITGDGELSALETVVTESRASSSQAVVPEEEQNNIRQHQDWGLHEEVVVENNDSVTSKAGTEEHSLPLITGEG